MPKIDITPAVRALINDDPAFPIGLTMNLKYAKLLHALVANSDYYQVLAPIEDCLTQAIEAVEAKQ